MIIECLQVAMQAATASNAGGGWQISATPPNAPPSPRSAGASPRTTWPRLAAAESDPQTQRVLTSALSLTETLADVPVHVIPCLPRRFDGDDLVVASSAWASIIQAGWSFMLALRSRGLGSVWTTMHLAREQEVAELVGVTQAALFPVAYTIGTDFQRASRPPAETVTFWDSLGGRPALSQEGEIVS